MKSIVFMVMMVFLTNISYSQTTNQHIMNHQEPQVSISENNKLLIKKLYEEILNKRQWHLLNSLIADEYSGLDGQTGPMAFKNSMEALINSFPDIHWQVVQCIADKDIVMIVQQVRGTHLGSFQQFPPTGKKFRTDGTAMYQLKDGKVIKSEIRTDRLATLQQLGIIPKVLTSLKDSEP